MNDTYRLISRALKNPRAKALYKNLDATLSKRMEHDATILAALVTLLIDVHLVLNVKEDKTICDKCANANLTELFQSIRQMAALRMDNMTKSRCCR